MAGSPADLAAGESYWTSARNARITYRSADGGHRRDEMSRLLPPSNYRKTRHKCCAACRHYCIDDDGYYVCARSPFRPPGDWRFGEPFQHVCDRFSWRKAKP